MISRLDKTVGDLDALRRVAAARRDIGNVADALMGAKTSRRADREQLARQLNAIKASLGTAEALLAGESS